MPTAIVSRNAVVTHCAAAAATSRLSMSGGVALLIIVSFKMTTNDETKIRLMTSLLRRAVSAAAASSRVVAFIVSLRRRAARCSRPWRLRIVRLAARARHLDGTASSDEPKRKAGLHRMRGNHGGHDETRFHCDECRGGRGGDSDRTHTRAVDGAR